MPKTPAALHSQRRWGTHDDKVAAGGEALKCLKL